MRSAHTVSTTTSQPLTSSQLSLMNTNHTHHESHLSHSSVETESVCVSVCVCDIEREGHTHIAMILVDQIVMRSDQNHWSASCEVLWPRNLIISLNFHE